MLIYVICIVGSRNWSLASYLYGSLVIYLLINVLNCNQMFYYRERYTSIQVGTKKLYIYRF